MTFECGHARAPLNTCLDPSGRSVCKRCYRAARQPKGLDGQLGVLGAILREQGWLPEGRTDQKDICAALAHHLNPDPADILLVLHAHGLVSPDPSHAALELAEEIAQVMASTLR